MRNWLKKIRKAGVFTAVLVLFAISPFFAQDADAFLGLFAQFTGIGDALGYFLASILMVPLMITSWLLWVSGALLNLVLDFTVIDLSQNIGGISGINIAWEVIRDLSNMIFIFALLYIAIGTILGAGGVNWKKGLINVIIAALLINFSLFFTKVIIDASNLVALTFYERLNPPQGDDIFASGLSNSFMEPLGLTTFFGVADGPALYKATDSVMKVAVVSFGGSMFFVVLSFVFLAISIMFLIRYVNIIFLLILSPIFFLGLVLPGIGAKMKQKWLESLTAQAVFAPVYMILTWVVLTVIRSGGFIQGGNLNPSNNTASGFAGSLSGIAEGSTANQDTFSLIMNFVIVIVFAIATLVISKQVADQGGSIGAKVVGGALGGAAFAGRLGGGWASSKLAGSKRLQALENTQAEEGAGRMARAGAFATRYAARTATSVGRAGAKGSWDARAGLSKIGGLVGLEKEADMGVGSAGGKGGFDAMKTQFREFRGAEGTKTAAERNERVRLAQAENNINAGLEAAEELRTNRGGMTPAQITQREEMVETMEQAINNMTNKEMELFLDQNREMLRDPEFATRINPQHLDAINKSDKFAEQEKNDLKNTRFAEASSIRGLPGVPVSANAPDRIRAITNRELEMMDPNVVTDEAFVQNMSRSQFDHVSGSDRFTQAQKTRMRNARNAPLFDALTPGPRNNPDRARNIISGMNPAELARLARPPAGRPPVLTDVAILPSLNISKLKRLANEIDNPQVIRDIRDAIITANGMVPGATGYNPAQADQVQRMADWLISPDGMNSFQ